MKRELDDILKQALTPMDEPDFWLNQKILSQEKETSRMDRGKLKRSAKRIPALLLSTAVVLAVGSVSVYAAWRYLTPDAVAELTQDEQLMKAFSSNDAVLVNETQSYGGYDITLLGIVSGENLSKYGTFDDGGEILADRTYSVVAIANSDGTPMADTSDDAYGETPFLVSPLIGDYNPIEYNIVTMGGGYTDIVIDGVLYRIGECDNVEMFADHTIYLCVSDGTFYNTGAYHYDAVTGVISRNEAYQGVNALFTLPIDTSKADADAVEAYMHSMQEADDTEVMYEKTSVDEFMEQITPENIDEYLKRVEKTVQVITPKEDGTFEAGYDFADYGSGWGTVFMDTAFPERESGMSPNMDYSYSDDSIESLIVNTYVLNEDGTVTYAVYVPKESSIID